MADLIVAHGGDFMTQVSGRHRVGALGQQLDWTGDSPGQKDPEPAGEQHHHQANHEQCQQIITHDRLLKRT